MWNKLKQFINKYIVSLEEDDSWKNCYNCKHLVVKAEYCELHKDNSQLICDEHEYDGVSNQKE